MMGMAATSGDDGKWKVHKDHVGHAGMSKYGDNGTPVPGDGILITITKLAFTKGTETRNAVVYVYFRQNDLTPLYAIGFELKDPPPAGNTVATNQPDPTDVPFLYEGWTSALNATGTIVPVKLQIYTKKAP